MKTRRSFIKFLPLIAGLPIISYSVEKNPLAKFGLSPQHIEYVHFSKICNSPHAYRMYNISVLQPNCEPMLINRPATPKGWRDCRSDKFIEDGWQVPHLIKLLQNIQNKCSVQTPWIYSLRIDSRLEKYFS